MNHQHIPESERSWQLQYYWDRKEQRLEYSRKVRVAGRKYLRMRKNNPCEDCGVIYPPAAMDFHHVEEKTFKISQNLARSIETLSEEIDKCILLCANCHRIRHHE